MALIDSREEFDAIKNSDTYEQYLAAVKPSRRSEVKFWAVLAVLLGFGIALDFTALPLHILAAFGDREAKMYLDKK